MINYYDKFSVLFHRDKLYVNGKVFPLGQITTDILNLDGDILREIDQRVDGFMTAVALLLKEKTDSAAHSAQEKLNAVWDLVFQLPLYRDLELDLDTSYHLFPLMFSDKEKWEEALDVNSEGHAMLERFLNGLEYFAESIRNFRGQVQGMLELYFEPLSRRGADPYAVAYAYYFTDMEIGGRVLLDEPIFEQSFPVEVKFVPQMILGEDEKVVMAEKTEFSYYSHFLYTEFYRALIAGNAPRRCHNCGKYFLLTAGYNTCYCNNIAPGETNRTCRVVGAHRKESKERADASPARKEYQRTYNRLKQRKTRGKISTDEWNNAVAKAQELLTQTEQGMLTDEELKKKLIEL